MVLVLTSSLWIAKVTYGVGVTTLWDNVVLVVSQVMVVDNLERYKRNLSK